MLKSLDLFNRTRPDIAHTISKLNRYTSNPGRVHWIAVERVFIYLKDTIPYYLRFVGYLAIL